MTHNPQAVIPGGGPQQSSVPKGAAGSYPHRLAMPYGPRSRSKLPHFVAALRASIAIAIRSDFGFGVYVGFVAGCFFTVGAAWVWSFYL
jgi:hypothetical protein